MTKLNRDQLVEMLVESEAKIAYTKKDGTARDVFATLKPSMIPEVTNPAPVKETHLTVFDTEKQQWRTLLVISSTSFVPPLPHTSTFAYLEFFLEFSFLHIGERFSYVKFREKTSA